MARTRPSIAGPYTISRAVREFVDTEVAGGLVLVIAAALALVWVNGPWGETYEEVWQTPLALTLGDWTLELDLRDWVNEALMSLFFLVVALEIKRELLEGELRDPRRAVLPLVAAIGGMVVPALIYAAIAGGGPAGRGWGIPMATDIAFALGVAALVARNLPSPLRLFLLTLAIVDDIGAILVIAIFYSGGIEWVWLSGAAVVLLVAYAIRTLGIVPSPVFVALGIGIWLCLHESGLHATLAGVAMGLLTPAKPSLDREIVVDRSEDMLDVYSPAAARSTSRMARLAVSQLEWLLHGLHPWTTLVVVPLFALANAGVALSGGALADAATSTVAWGVVAGLVVGKTIGIAGTSWLACRVGIASLPSGARWSNMIGIAALGGIGFTVSLFISELAFPSGQFADDAKIAILAASVAASAIGAVILRTGRAYADEK